MYFSCPDINYIYWRKTVGIFKIIILKLLSIIMNMPGP